MQDSVFVKATQLESETQKKVADSIHKIEAALSQWDSSKKKPRELAKDIDYLKKTYKLLLVWEAESLKGRKNLESILGRLEKFEEMCKMLDEKRPS